MPELPEVETLRRALLPLVVNKTCTGLSFYRKDIRFPIPQDTLQEHFSQQVVHEIQRLGKYLLLKVPHGAMLLHLGMSGRVILNNSMAIQEKHTHAIFQFGAKTCLHFVDPRRFGCILWVPQNGEHPLLDKMGPDPFSPEANAQALKIRARKCKSPIKTFIMDARRITGIGNIYACESLFQAGINPQRQAGRITLAEWDRLLSCVRSTLENSISAGGTTLRDFFDPNGSAGYYAVKLSVYGKEGQPCQKCKTPLSRRLHSGRSTFFCKSCQKK
ncbi:MAG: bifunctional DNA-formamidopyrimidine glycosylase/DNA-(apurinic or apyrimidinic site) lyase [Nitrospina sp.]|nr:bifunctional DNA-formamidopyrimidine glycosylase/DNA-(apurinic or apyrimidinic site) lyase [Nitrospina sp.]